MRTAALFVLLIPVFVVIVLLIAAFVFVVLGIGVWLAKAVGINPFYGVIAAAVISIGAIMSWRFVTEAA